MSWKHSNQYAITYGNTVSGNIMRFPEYFSYTTDGVYAFGLGKYGGIILNTI
jgi:hypothetical protein